MVIMTPPWRKVIHCSSGIPGIPQELSFSDLQLDVISFNAAISACEKGHQRRKAFGVLRSMGHAQLEPTPGNRGSEKFGNGKWPNGKKQ